MTDYKGKYAFISHPYKDNPEENKKSVDRICKYLAGQGIIPISPIHLFSFYENDNNREEIMNICYELIKISDVYLCLEIVKDVEWRENSPMK